MSDQPKYVYDTLSEAVNDLLKRGYTTDFLLSEEKDCLVCRKTATALTPEEFEIDEVYRFDEMTDPADETILFAISSKTNDMKGMVINSFGADFSYRSSRLVERLKIHL